MTPASWPRTKRSETRLLHVDPVRRIVSDARIGDLPNLLRAGDVVVLNDAATLPAALPARFRSASIEIRLASPGHTAREWTAVAFGPGSWRQRTEERAAPPALAPGDRLEFAAGLTATVTTVSSESSRLLELQFDRDGVALWAALYRAGRPVQYAYVAAPLDLWHVQTAYAGRPWAVEMPSAGWALDIGVLRALRARSVSVATLTHAAGLSSTGDAGLDAMLPLPERSDIPEATVAAIERARGGGGRVVAVGTTVVRALEGRAAAGDGRLRAGIGVTDLRIGPGFEPRVVDGVLTGMHSEGTSHYELLHAFAPADLLAASVRRAAAAGYWEHEFGDTSLVLAESSPCARYSARMGQCSAALDPERSPRVQCDNRAPSRCKTPSSSRRPT